MIKVSVTIPFGHPHHTRAMNLIYRYTRTPEFLNSSPNNYLKTQNKKYMLDITKAEYSLLKKDMARENYVITKMYTP